MHMTRKIELSRADAEHIVDLLESNGDKTPEQWLMLAEDFRKEWGMVPSPYLVYTIPEIK